MKDKITMFLGLTVLLPFFAISSVVLFWAAVGFMAWDFSLFLEFVTLGSGNLDKVLVGYRILVVFSIAVSALV